MSEGRSKVMMEGKDVKNKFSGRLPSKAPLNLPRVEDSGVHYSQFYPFFVLKLSVGIPGGLHEQFVKILMPKRSSCAKRRAYIRCRMLGRPCKKEKTTPLACSLLYLSLRSHSTPYWIRGDLVIADGDEASGSEVKNGVLRLQRERVCRRKRP